MKIDRLLAITLYLVNRKAATARELAERFEVSVRTIQRDMNSLALAGIPIYADRGSGGGYRIIEDYSVDRQFFTRKELAALTSLVGRLSNLLGPSDLQTTEEKLINLQATARCGRIHEPLIIDLTPWGLDERIRRLFRTAYRAVEEAQVLRIRYASASGEITQRQIEPLSMLIKGSAWYVYAFCRLRCSCRLFKLTRVLDACPVPIHFSPHEHPAYRDESDERLDLGCQTLFVLRFANSARGRISDFVSSDNVHAMPDGSLMGFFPFFEDEWVYTWILSFGPLVEVLEPPHARRRMSALTRALKETYTPEPPLDP